MNFHCPAILLVTLLLMQLHHTAIALNPTDSDHSYPTVAAIVEGTFRQRNQLLNHAVNDIVAATDQLFRSISAVVRQQLGRVPDGTIDRQIMHLARQYIIANWLIIDRTSPDIEENINDTEQRIDERLANSGRLSEFQGVQKSIHTVYWQWKRLVEHLLVDRIDDAQRILAELIHSVLSAKRSGGGVAAVDAALRRNLKRLKHLFVVTVDEVFQQLSVTDARIRQLATILIAADRQLEH